MLVEMNQKLQVLLDNANQASTNNAHVGLPQDNKEVVSEASP